MRWYILAGGLVAALALVVQLGASAMYGALATSPSLPHAIAGDWPLRAAAATGLDRVPLLRPAFARAAVFAGDDARAATLLATLGNGRTANDLRARLALQTNDPDTALRDFAAADDYVAARAAITTLAARDPLAALRVIRGFDERLAQGAAPEIEADIVWREGQIAAAVAYAHPELAKQYDRIALDAYRRALVRAPNEETYLLAYGFQALVAGDPEGSLAAYRRATQVVPDSLDAFIGVVVAAAVTGRCDVARETMPRVQRLAAQDHRPVDPHAAGYRPGTAAALARCGM